MSLARHIQVFAHRYPRLSEPDFAAGYCCIASNLFARAVPGARVMYLLGSRRYFPERVDEYPAKDLRFFHAVVVVGQTAIDWTRRQLDPRCHHPFIQPLAALRREWIKLGRSPEELGC